MLDVEIIENTREAQAEYGYMWGADEIILTQEMLAALQQGKCIAGNNGEYVTFVYVEK